MLEKLAMENLPKCWRLMSGMSTWVIPQLQTEIYRHKAWLVIDPNKQIFFDTDGEEQWKASIDLASHRMMETFF